MSDHKHPVWFLLFVLLVGGLGLGYCQVVYHNGSDPLKDGGLIALVAGLVGLWAKFSGSGSGSS